jgi:alpha-beta hydrolase superfamily lysophospholipase
LRGYEQARQTARQNQVPLFLVAFSYGGLMGLDLLASREDVRFQSAVLFAPALSLRGWDYAIRLFSPFPGWDTGSGPRGISRQFRHAYGRLQYPV